MPMSKTTTAILALTLFTTSTLAQATTSSSSFNWDSLISAAETATSSWDLYTTDGELGPGVFDTSSRYGLYTSATPIVGPIGNGTVANGTATNGTTTGAGGAGPTAGGGSGAGSQSSGSESASAPPQATDNVAALRGDGVLMGGLGAMIGLGALMAAL